MSYARYQTMSLPASFLKELAEVIASCAMYGPPDVLARDVRDSILRQLHEMNDAAVMPLTMMVVQTYDPIFTDGIVCLRDLVQAFSLSGNIEVAKFTAVATAMATQLLQDQIRVGIEGRYDPELYNVRAALANPQVKDMIDALLSHVVQHIAAAMYKLQMDDMLGRER